MAIIGISGRIGSGKDTVGKIILYYTFCKKGFGGAKASVEDCVKWLNGEYPGTLVEDITDWKIKKFADKLKDMVCLLIGCTREQLEDQDFKNKELGEEWWYYKSKYGTLVNYQTYNGRVESKDLICLTPRLLLQLLGTECGRDIIHPNIWCNSLMSGYKPNCSNYNSKLKQSHNHNQSICKDCNCLPNWIISDMRFPNEMEAVKDKGGISIRIEREQEFSIFNDKAIETHSHPSETSLDSATFDYIIDNNGTIEELIKKVKEILIKENII